MRRISEKFLRKKLQVANNYLDPVFTDSIMEFSVHCNCDGGRLCKHRLDWLIQILRNEDLILDDAQT